MRAAIYARFSSDLQRDASIDDQIRDCRAYAKHCGLTVIDTYSDRGISGASTLTRPDFQRMLRDAKAGRFDVIIIEALDRLSRNLADTARIHDELKFCSVQVQTISSGVVDTMQVGFMGTMNQMFLDELAKKTRRGQRGRVEAGRIPGGLSYGYDMVCGDERGKRTINTNQADVVRRIFTEYARGYSPRKIAANLNREGIPSPRCGEWQASTINGNVKRGNGILPNRLYIGEIVYNRQTFMKDPCTGKRRGRANPENEWLTMSVPELAIIEPELWAQVVARKAANKRPEHYRRSRHLISGILRCEACGGPYTVNGINHMRCSHRYERGTCENKTSVKIAEAESRILDKLKDFLTDPIYIQAFIEEYRTAWEKLANDHDGNRDKLERQLLKCTNALSALITAVEGGLVSDTIIAKIKDREREATSIRDKIDKQPKHVNLPMPANLAKRWNTTLNNIRKHIANDEVEPASDELKRVVNSVIVKPKDNGSYELLITADLTNNIGCGGRI